MDQVPCTEIYRVGVQKDILVSWKETNKSLAGKNKCKIAPFYSFKMMFGVFTQVPTWDLSNRSDRIFCKRMSLRSVSILCVKNINFSKMNFMRLIHPVYTDSHKGKSVYKVKCPYHSIVKKSSLAHSFCLHSTKSNILTNFIS